MPSIASRVSLESSTEVKPTLLEATAPSPGAVSITAAQNYLRSPLGAEFLDDAHALSMYPDSPYFVRGFLTTNAFTKNTAFQALAAAGVKIQ